ncbi:unnamed protein product [Paramecium sonneborni]|uniref:Uncharacterized protein n=1 Tax=Paramecium sonneborni TaxID=65129 RepID=A0A8S1RP81_9CILI|nr:unnamed protein product [Paramecium sonneborni]
MQLKNGKNENRNEFEIHMFLNQAFVQFHNFSAIIQKIRNLLNYSFLFKKNGKKSKLKLQNLSMILYQIFFKNITIKKLELLLIIVKQHQVIKGLIENLKRTKSLGRVVIKLLKIKIKYLRIFRQKNVRSQQQKSLLEIIKNFFNYENWHLNSELPKRINEMIFESALLSLLEAAFRSCLLLEMSKDFDLIQVIINQQKHQQNIKI